MSNTRTDYNQCTLCGKKWIKVWDVDNYNDDFDQCPECEEFEFEEITKAQFYADETALSLRDWH